MGTPHKGSNFPRLANFQIGLGKLFGIQSENRLLQILSTNSELLGYLQREFSSVQKKPELANLTLYCYYETKNVKEGPLSVGKVVEERSACLDGATCRAFDKDHMGLNKFTPDDKYYREAMKVDLDDCLRETDTIVGQRFAARRYGSETANPHLQ